MLVASPFICNGFSSLPLAKQIQSGSSNVATEQELVDYHFLICCFISQNTIRHPLFIGPLRDGRGHISGVSKKVYKVNQA